MFIEYNDLKRGADIEFDYVNWRGEHSRRKAVVRRVVFGANEWHKEPQFLLEAVCYEKIEVRYFAINDMKNIKFCKNAP